jgi:hypothetical protein
MLENPKASSAWCCAWHAFTAARYVCVISHVGLLNGRKLMKYINISNFQVAYTILHLIISFQTILSRKSKEN